MSEKLATATALINECKSRGYYDKPVPEDETKALALADILYKKALEAYESGKKGEDITAIVSIGKSLEKSEEGGPDDKRYKELIMEEIEGLPVPIRPDGGEVQMPFSLEALTDKEILKYLGIYNSCAAYANYQYSLEEAGEASAKIIADEYFDKFLVEAEKKDPETNKPKTHRQLEAEAKVKDKNISKWRTLQNEHSVRASRYKRLRDIYTDNCERLSRAFTVIQDERKYSNG
jgi:hypothetical protein